MIVEEHENKLVVVDEWQTDWNKPEEYRHYWPTGIFANDYPQYVGRSVREVYPGLYAVVGEFSLPCLGLEEREKTRPCHIETRPVKRPRWAKQWYCGRWER